MYLSYSYYAKKPPWSPERFFLHLILGAYFITAPFCTLRSIVWRKQGIKEEIFVISIFVLSINNAKFSMWAILHTIRSRTSFSFTIERGWTSSNETSSLGQRSVRRCIYVWGITLFQNHLNVSFVISIWPFLENDAWLLCYCCSYTCVLKDNILINGKLKLGETL